MLGLKKQVHITMYRMKLRKALSNETDECLAITLEEVRKEINRRNERKKK